jgi:hypothetical protein
LVFTFSCKKPEKYSTTPVVTFKEIPVKDTTIFSNHIKRCILTYSLVDGDGDIGFQDGDTIYPYNIDGSYYNNVMITMYKMVNGVYFPVDTPEIGTPFYFRTKYIEPIGQNKTLKCTIYINLDFDIPSSWDTVKFDFFMYDRALNKSNIESTPMVILQ